MSRTRSDRARSNIEPPRLGEVLRTVWRVTLLRCPVCGRGRIASGAFRINERCSECGVVFERSVGEFTGGMGLSAVITCFGIAALSFWVGASSIPLGIGMPLVALFAVLFPILFYRHSRALWVGILHLAGLVHHDDRADPEPEIRPWRDEPPRRPPDSRR